MRIEQHSDGSWAGKPSAEEQRLKPDWAEAVPRYFGAFEPVFEKARERGEFEFIHALLGVRGLQDAGWVAYETTLQAIDSATKLHNEISDPVAARHLKLWIYGHIVEASEPYELLANLLAIAGGARYRIDLLGQRAKDRPISPATKIDQIAKLGREQGFPNVENPLREIWDGEVRNAIFHADYTLHGVQVRLPTTGRNLKGDEVEQLSGRASAYHEVMARLRNGYLQSYDKPKIISAHGFSDDPNEKAVVLVREGHGAVGLKHAWTRSELQGGAIPWRIAALSQMEGELLDEDPELAFLPDPSTADG